jgi:hypothetical protein
MLLIENERRYYIIYKLKRFISFFLIIITISFIPCTSVSANEYVPPINNPTTWQSFLEWVATSLGVTVSELTPAMLQPYLVGLVTVGSAAYLGYDIYKNHDDIINDISIWLTGNSAFSSYWFEEVGQKIINNEIEVGDTITVPLNIFQSVQLAIKNTLPIDNTGTMSSTFTKVSSTSISMSDISNYAKSLGYSGSTIGNIGGATQIKNPVVFYDSAELGECYYFVHNQYNGTGTNGSIYKNMFICETAGNLYFTIPNDYAISQIGGMYMLKIGISGSMWSSFKVGDTGTQGLMPYYPVSSITVTDNGIYSIDENGYTWRWSVLTPSDSSVFKGSFSYDTWVDYSVNIGASYPSYVDVMPWYTGFQLLDIADTPNSTYIQDLLDNIGIAVTDLSYNPTFDIVGDLPLVIDGNGISALIDFTDGIIDSDTAIQAIDTVTFSDAIPVETGGILDEIGDFFTGLFNRLFEFLQSILDALLSIPTILSGLWIDIATWWSNLIDTLDDIGQNILDIPGNILDGIKEVFEWLFVPNSVAISDILSEMVATVENRLGLLTYPLSLLVKFLTEVSQLETTECIISIPKIQYKNMILYEGTTYNFSEFTRQENVSSLYSIFRLITNGIMILSVLNLAIKKGSEIIRGN